MSKSIINRRNSLKHDIPDKMSRRQALAAGTASAGMIIGASCGQSPETQSTNTSNGPWTVLDRKPFWHYRRCGVEALLSMGKKSEALQYAEGSRGLNQPDSAIDQACEEILTSSGLHDEAYRRYGLRAAQGKPMESLRVE